MNETLHDLCANAQSLFTGIGMGRCTRNRRLRRLSTI
jgi:hypothetical protein